MLIKNTYVYTYNIYIHTYLCVICTLLSFMFIKVKLTELVDTVYYKRPCFVVFKFTRSTSNPIKHKYFLVTAAKYCNTLH